MDVVDAIGELECELGSVEMLMGEVRRVEIDPERRLYDRPPREPCAS